MFPGGQIAPALALHADRGRQHPDAPRRLKDPTARPRATVRMLLVERADLPPGVLSPDATT